MLPSRERRRIPYLQELLDTFCLSSLPSLDFSAKAPARQSFQSLQKPLCAMERTNTMSSSSSVNCAATNCSACVRSAGFPALLDTHSHSEVWATAAPYPPPSSRSSRPSFDNPEDAIKPTDNSCREYKREVCVPHATLFFLHSSCPIRRLPVTAIGARLQGCSMESHSKTIQPCET